MVVSYRGTGYGRLSIEETRKTIDFRHGPIDIDDGRLTTLVLDA